MSSYNLDQMNHFVLQKHHLTDDSKIDNIVQIVRDISGLHATGSTTPYFSLFSRMNNFTRDKLDEELYIKKTLGKIRCVRKTVYVIPKERIPATHSATKKMAELISERHYKYLGVTEKEYKEISKKIMQIIKGKGMIAKEIRNELGTKFNISPIVNLMCDQGLLMRGKSHQGWKSNIHTYYRFDEFFPDLNLDSIDEEKARASLVKQYIASFGPVTINDISWWTGFQKGQIKKIVGDFKSEMTNVEILGIDDDFIMLDSDKMRLSSVKFSSKSTINLLPGLDPYMMGYKDRERCLDQKYYNFIFGRGGNATTSILLDGRAIGVWDYAEPFVKIFLFNEVDREVSKKIHAKAESIGKFIFGKKVTIKEYDSMVSLTKRTAGGFMSPLKD